MCNACKREGTSVSSSLLSSWGLLLCYGWDCLPLSLPISGATRMSHAALSQLTEVKFLNLELLYHTAKDNSWVLSFSVWSGSWLIVFLFLTLDTMTKSCMGFLSEATSNRLAGKKDILFYGYSCPAHISLQKEQWRSLAQFLHSPRFAEFASCLSPFLRCLDCLLVWYNLRKMSWVEATRD